MINVLLFVFLCSNVPQLLSLSPNNWQLSSRFKESTSSSNDVVQLEVQADYVTCSH